MRCGESSAISSCMIEPYQCVIVIGCRFAYKGANVYMCALIIAKIVAG